MNDMKWEDTTNVSIFGQINVIKKPKTQPEDPFIYKCTNQEPHLCNQCGFETHLMINLKKHRKENCQSTNFTQKNSYACKNCQFQTFSSLILLKHSNNCATKRRQHPRNCRRFFVDSRDFSFDSRTTNGTLRFECKQCPYTSIKKPNLIYHIKYQHVPPEYVNFFKCSHCTYKTKKRGHLNRHISTQHPPFQKSRQISNNWYSCDQCCYGNNQKSNLQRHLLTHLKEKDIKWYSCGRCSYRNKNKYLVTLHEKKKHGVKVDGAKVKCGICDYKATKRCHLKEHVQAKHINFKFYCNECSFSSAWKGALKNHILRSHALKMY